MPLFVPPIEVKSPAIRTAPDESVVRAYILPGLDPVRTSPTEKVGSIAPVCENVLKLFPKKKISTHVLRVTLILLLLIATSIK
jgi:hypothetical protein